MTVFVTGTPDSFVRVYGTDDGDIYGGFLARPRAVKFKRRAQIIDDFALWDDTIVTDGDGWADYQCLAKVVVPNGYKLRMSTAGDFEAHRYPRLMEDLSGGIKQFQTRDGEIEADNWIPLGRIDKVSPRIASEMKSADPGEEHADGVCAT